MRAKILLADSAQTDPAGKVHALGLGWSVTSTPTPPAAVIVLIDVPWDQTNQANRVVIELLDEDGNTVAPGGELPGGDQPIRIEAEFEVGRPPGLPMGTAIGHPIALNLAPGIPLAAGKTYEWRLTINGENREEWSAPFLVR